MAQLLANEFSSYTLTVAEEELGQQFNIYQEYVLRNKFSALAMEKLSLTYDPDNPQKFLQREAELQGQIGILRWLLASSDAVKTDVSSRTRQE